MKDSFTDKEKKFFNRLKPERLTIKHIVAFILIILFVGFIFDGTSGFPIIRGSSNILALIGSLFFLGILYICGEGLGGWLTAKDDVSQPLLKRILNLLMLLGFFALFSFFVYKVLTFLGIKI